MTTTWEQTIAHGHVKLVVSAAQIELVEVLNGDEFGAICVTADFLSKGSLEAENVRNRVQKRFGAAVVTELENAARSLVVA
jgi:hypothetical protein